MAAGISLIVGLGNPGAEYARTRHNAGFWFVDRLAGREGGTFRREGKFHGDVARVTVAGAGIWLLKPQAFMNLSGNAVAALTRFFRIAPNQMLVAHDELDLSPGTVRLKKGGGAGGHNGLSDIIEKLATGDFYRLRIGIGHPGSRDLIMPFVLGAPSAEDERQIEAGIVQALEELPLVVDGHYGKAMTRLNRRSTASDPAATD